MEKESQQKNLTNHAKKRAINRNNAQNSLSRQKIREIFEIADNTEVSDNLDIFSKNENMRTINDMSYGFITFNKFVWNIIDTQHVQRLRYLTQLGSLFWVFPSADFSRFEHSLGVAHMAGIFSDISFKRGGGIGMSLAEKDYIKESLVIAGLCHDLGHGPFSHVFDGTVIPTL